MSLPNRKRNASLAGAFFAGAASGCCSTILFQPFDVVKTRQQECLATGAKRYVRFIPRVQLKNREKLGNGIETAKFNQVVGNILPIIFSEAESARVSQISLSS